MIAESFVSRVRSRSGATFGLVVVAVLGVMLFAPSAPAQVPPPPPDDLDAAVPKAAAEADGQAEIEGQAKVQGEAEAAGQADIQTQGQAGAEAATEAKQDADAQGRAGADADVDAGAERSREGDAETRADANFGLGVEAQNGRLTVRSVESGSAMARANLRTDDEIIAVNDRRIATQAELDAELRAARDRDGRATLTVFRDGRLQTIQADLGPAGFAGPPPSLAPRGERVESFYRGGLQPAQRPIQGPFKGAAQKPFQKPPVQKAAGHPHDGRY